LHIGLFVPCYMDQFYPQAAKATWMLLNRLGCRVTFPQGQTCCGQPLANAGNEEAARASYNHYIKTFEGFDFIVTPSGSCAYHVRHHYDLLDKTETVTAVREKTLDLSEFLLDVLKISELPARYPHRVGLHQSCHGLRGLHLGCPSESLQKTPSRLHLLLSMVEGLTLVDLQRRDECCGFGGTFAIKEPDISVRMGRDRIKDHLDAGAEVITSGDMSCLMHLEGLINRRGIPLRVMHIAEILNAGSP